MIPLNPVETIALSKAIDSKVYAYLRPKVRPGLYAPDMTVRIYGTMNVGEDYSQRIVATVDPWLLLCLAISRSSKDRIARLVADAIALPDDAAEQLKADCNGAIGKLKDSTLRPCKGKVTAQLMATRIEETHEENPNRSRSRQPNKSRRRGNA